VRLRRFFDAAGDWIFLIDEAHNLPGRARDMYSAQLTKSSLTGAKKAMGKGKGWLKTALNDADRTLLAARRAVEQLAPRADADEPADRNTNGRADRTSQGDPVQLCCEQTAFFDSDPAESASSAPSAAHPEQARDDSTNPDTGFALPAPLYAQGGTVFFQELPHALVRPLAALAAPLQDWLEDHTDAPAHAELLELYFSLQDFLRTAERYDTHYVTQLTAAGSELRIELLCLDPSAFVDSALATGRTAALFSATLAPPGYYRSILGCEGARAVALPSPFPPAHLGLYCLPGISTRYRQREASIRPISDALAAMVRAKAGNYLAFFPSYAYLKQVVADFAARYPDIPTLVQESGLDDAQREEFLRRFAPAPSGSLLGFGVLGGVFGEGVDLAGDRLIGCAIVGVGLPQVNPRQEMLRRYFDEKNGCGFDYAYRYPGMNKVLQAAGRVIRTEADKGVVLLLDDRFARAEYRALFPAHWAHLRYLPGPEALQAALADFWREAPCPPLVNT
jgi:Rad3-related DNA helicase